MCRLYAIRSNEATKVECTLVHAQNALMLQSRADLTGRTHADGWGIAFYHNEHPEIERRSSAAYRDLHFSDTAQRIYSRTVIAHVRQATVGETRVENAHPFIFGRWAFAHNGTVRGFDILGDELSRETVAELRAERRGATDSEQLFLWLLSRLVQAGIDIRRANTDFAVIAGVIASSIRKLAARCEAIEPLKPAKLNIVLTDGERLFTTRWNNSLHYVVRHGIHDCRICGIPHVHHTVGESYRAIVVASEPISDEPWIEAPECSLLCIDQDVQLHVQPIADGPNERSTFPRKPTLQF